MQRPTDAHPSLLPPQATALERDLEQVTVRTSAVPVPEGDIWHADRCPAPLLGWLAWAVSVDEWDPAWSDAAKRAVIKNAPLIHQRKGTLWAVTNALAPFGVGTQVQEWWQASPPGEPGTFMLTTELTPDSLQRLGSTLTPKLNAQIKRVVDGVKPVSRSYTMRMSCALGSQLTMASIGTASQYLDSRGALTPLDVAVGTGLRAVSLGTPSQFVSSSGTAGFI